MRLKFVWTLLVAFVPTATAAQTRVFIETGPLFDVRATSHVDGAPLTNLSEQGFRVFSAQNTFGSTGAVISPDIAPDGEKVTSSKGRFGPGASVAVGAFLSSAVSVQVEGHFRSDQVITIESVDRQGVFRAETRQTTSISDVVLAVGWHQGQSRRASVSYLGGMILRRTREDFATNENYTLTSLLPPSPRTLTREESYGSTLFSAGIMAGIDVAVKLSPHLAIVPQVRLLAANNEWNLRPAVAVRWRP